MREFDKIIIGAGIYGLYAAEVSARKGESVLVLEYEAEAFQRASYINQARVHNGYHYPRSFSTAQKSAGYFQRFVHDYGDCINSKFKKVYATSTAYSWTGAAQFRQFCQSVGVKCTSIDTCEYFNDNVCEGAFETDEYCYDAMILRQMLLHRLADLPVTVRYKSVVNNIQRDGADYVVSLRDGGTYSAPYLLNATYASINQILTLLKLPLFSVKYELCEIILCKVSPELQNVGITVMDGPFFSIMPFGDTGCHSLTSVAFTPHATSTDALPTFNCQKVPGVDCSPDQLGNCNLCKAKPVSAWPYMSTLARKYLQDRFSFEYVDSLYSMKPILRTSEIDDSRPTVIRKFTENPTLVCVLSGKVNTIYDIEEVL